MDAALSSSGDDSSGTKKTPPIGAYWQATRSYSFPASIVPTLLGTALAARGYFGAPAQFDWLILTIKEAWTPGRNTAAASCRRDC